MRSFWKIWKKIFLEFWEYSKVLKSRKMQKLEDWEIFEFLKRWNFEIREYLKVWRFVGLKVWKIENIRDFGIFDRKMIFLKGIKSNYSIKKDFFERLGWEFECRLRIWKASAEWKSVKLCVFFLHPSCNCDHRKFVNFFFMLHERNLIFVFFRRTSFLIGFD